MGRKFNGSRETGRGFQTAIRFRRKRWQRRRNRDRSSASMKPSDFAPSAARDRFTCSTMPLPVNTRLPRRKTCTFRISKMILQREIPKEQVQKLIDDRQDRSASEVHLEERPRLFRALEVGERQSRFRVCRTCTEAEKIRRAKVRGRRVSVAVALYRRGTWDRQTRSSVTN